MKKLPTVAIVGQANAGKSSLFNRILGSNDAIVAREAGTTRDNVVRKIYYHTTNRGDIATSGSPETFRPGAELNGFWLVDTAGLKTAEDEFEASIQDQIEEATQAADVIIVLVDSTIYPTDRDRLVAKKALKSRKPVILALNKTDLKTSLDSEEFRRLGIKPVLEISATQGKGTDDLMQEIVALLPDTHTEPDDDTLRIALIGRPNVGKSHLFNTLAGKQQAIVANIAGTTRDINRVAVNYHGRKIELLDTAGIRRSGKIEVGIEKFSVIRTIQAIDEADICLLLMDVNELSTQLDQKIAGMIKDAGRGLVLVVSKWDAVEGKDAFTRDALAPRIAYEFNFVPWAPLIFTSSVTGQNVTKLFDLALEIDQRRKQQIATRELNKLLQFCLRKHPPAGLKNTHPKLRYMVQTDTNPPWFVIFGSNLKFIHWSYIRYLERAVRDNHDYVGTPIKFSFRDEKQIKANREKALLEQQKELPEDSQS